MSSVALPEVVVAEDSRLLPAAPVSFAAFLAWTDEDTHAEWVAGEIQMPSPARDEHQDLRDFLTGTMRPYVAARQLGWVRGGFLMRLASRPSGREPDIVFVAQEHVDRIGETYLDGPADLVVEIVSPESIARDRGEKFIEYETDGVREYWLLDPQRREALFYLRGADGMYHAAAIDPDGVYHATALPGFWIEVDWLWQRPLPAIEPIFIELGDDAYAYYLLDRLRTRLGDTAIRDRLDTPPPDA